MKLFIVPSWYPTTLHPESGSFFADRARILQTGGHEVTVITVHIHSLRHYFRYRRLKHRHTNPQNENGLTTYRFETVNPWPKIQRRFFYYYRRQLLRLWDLAVAERGKPDAAVINSSLWAGATLADRLEHERIPFVVSEHLKEFLTPGSFTAFQYNAIIKTFFSAARIVATSSALKKGIALNFPQIKEKIHIIANPVDTDIFRPALKTAETTIFTFVTTALFRPEKRIDLLIKAFAQLKFIRPNTRLVIIGDGPERNRLRKLIKYRQLEQQITLEGYQPQAELHRILKCCHALVLTSTVETFGVALIEAMACGLPVIATRCGGPEDIVTDATGLLVDKDDPVAIQRGLERMIDEYQNFDPALIRRTAIERFGSANYIKQYTDLLSNI